MKREGPALVFALAYPTLLAWFYFLLLAPSPLPLSRSERGRGEEGAQANPLQQAAYATGKGLQFAFPLLFLWWFDGVLPRPDRPRFDRLLTGLAFGLVVLAGMLALYFGLLRDSGLFAETPGRVRHKLEEFGLTTLPAYVGLAAFVSLLHSFLEEYYWRWFVFGRMRRHLSFGPAAAVSSLAFMSHHVVVLYVYLPGYFWTAVVPLSLCVAVGGVMWAWLFEQSQNPRHQDSPVAGSLKRGGSIYTVWLSHLMVDAGIFIIGYDLLRGTMFAR